MLATGRVEAIGQFTVGEPLLEQAVAPAKLVRLGYRDAGLDFYGNGLVASEQVIREQPDMVRRFVAATLRGMAYAFEHPEEAGQILHSYHRHIDPAIGAAETREVASLVDVSGTMGLIDPDKIRQTVEVVSSSFDMQRTVTADELFAAGFVAE